jgi:hypothetical protein
LPGLGVAARRARIHLQERAIGFSWRKQNLLGWRRLEVELAAALRSVRGNRNPAGFSLLTVGVSIVVAITYWLSRDPAGVEQALGQMLRQ